MKKRKYQLLSLWKFVRHSNEIYVIYAPFCVVGFCCLCQYLKKMTLFLLHQNGSASMVIQHQPKTISSVVQCDLYSIPCKGIRNLESWALESVNQFKESRIPLTTGIQNPNFTEKECRIQYLESGIHSQDSMIQVCLGWPYMRQIYSFVTFFEKKKKRNTMNLS